MSQTTLESMGKELARLRKQRGLTQQALADRCGIARSTLARFEVGLLSDFGVRKLLTALDAMDCTLTVQEASGTGTTLDDLRREREGRTAQGR